MKNSYFLLIAPIFCFSQYDYALKLHNNAREIYTNYSIDKFQLNENNFGTISFLSYSEELAEEFFKWYDSDHNKNFWFTQIAIGYDGAKVLLSDEEYVTNAVLNWTQLEFDYEDYMNGNEINLRSKEISDFMNVVWGNNTLVGFGVAKNDSCVFVVASYGF